MLRDRRPDPLGCRLDLPVAGMGIAKRHRCLAVAKKLGHDRKGDTLHDSLAGIGMAKIMKTDILDAGLAAHPAPASMFDCKGFF